MVASTFDELVDQLRDDQLPTFVTGWDLVFVGGIVGLFMPTWLQYVGAVAAVVALGLRWGSERRRIRSRRP